MKSVDYIMSKLSCFYRWCCNSRNDEEEEEEEKLPPVHRKIEVILNKPTADMQNLNPISNFLEESSILAAPSPKCDSSVTEFPRLRLKIIESSASPIGTTLYINSLCMENSRRSKNDSKVFVGSRQFNLKGEPVNDFVIEESQNGMGGQHFLISFDNSSQKYLISDLGEGTGTFLRLDSPLLLQEGNIVSFGSSHITVHYNAATR